MLVSCRGHSKIIIISYIGKLNSGLGKMSWMSWSEGKKTCKDCVRDGGGARSIKKYLLNMILLYCEINSMRVISGSLPLMSVLDETIKHGSLPLNNTLCEVYIEWCKKWGSISLVLIFCKICKGGRQRNWRQRIRKWSDEMMIWHDGNIGIYGSHW